MSKAYFPCICGSGKKVKFCCHNLLKEGKMNNMKVAHAQFPVVNCWILSDWERRGVSPVIVVREIEKGAYAFVSYLVDFWCLGVKDVIIKIGVGEDEIDRTLQRFNAEFEPLSYEDARSVILGSIEYAGALGISPRREYEGFAASFVEADRPFERKFEFGDDGKPHYMAGHYDDEYLDVMETARKVEAAGGYYTLGMA